MTSEDVEIAAQWTLEPGVFVPALVEVGYLDGAEGSYKIHDWPIHQTNESINLCSLPVRLSGFRSLFTHPYSRHGHR